MMIARTSILIIKAFGDEFAQATGVKFARKELRMQL
jgi:hypothetical protein